MITDTKLEKMKKNLPKISVIVTFYNVEDCVKYCMDSLVAQDYMNCEFLCIDDGSNDNTPELLDLYCDFDRFKIFHKKNGGLSDARNYGLDRASGEYVTFIDGDDFVHPKYLSILTKTMIDNDSDIVMCPLKVVRYIDTINCEKSLMFSEISYKHMNRQEIFTNILYNKLSVSACGKMIPISAYTDIRFPLGKVSEEVATIGKMLEKYNDYMIVEQPLYGYVMRTNSIGHKRNVPFKDIQDRIESYKTLTTVINNNFSTDNVEIYNALEYAWAIRYVSMALLYERVTDRKSELFELIKNNETWLKEHSLNILKNNNAPFLQRIRIVLYAYFPLFYKILYKTYQRIRFGL